MPAAKSVGFVQYASLSGAATLATANGGSTPTTADYAIVQAQDQPCRYRFDGTSPTGTVGSLLAVGDSVVVSRGQFANFKIIETAASAKINVEFFKTD